MKKSTYMLICALLYAYIIYSVGLSWRLGGEGTLRLSDSEWIEHSGTVNDNNAYMSFDPIAPYKYRVLPIGIAEEFYMMGLSPLWSYVLVNVISAWLMAMLFTVYLITWHDMNYIEAMLGGVLSLVVVAVPSTLLLPMVDIPAMLATLCLFASIRSGKVFYFVVASIGAVATKEVLLAGGFLWFAYHNEHPLIKRIAVASVPIVAFMAIRALMGSSPLEVNYGYDMLSGQLPTGYAVRLLSVDGWIELLSRTALAMGALWLGLYKLYDDRFLMLSVATFVLPTIIACWLLSSRIARPLGVEYIVMIPLFLMLFKTRKPAYN